MSEMKHAALCRRVEKALRHLVAEYASVVRSNPELVEAILKIEAEEISKGGLVLTASNTLDDWTTFTLRYVATNDICAQFECRTDTGEFRDTNTCLRGNDASRAPARGRPKA